MTPGKPGKIIRNAAKLREDMEAVLQDMETALADAYRLANGDPRTAELYIQIAQGKIALLRNKLTTDYDRLMRYAAPTNSDSDDDEVLEQRMDLLTEENNDLKRRIAALEQRDLLPFRQRGAG